MKIVICEDDSTYALNIKNIIDEVMKKNNLSYVCIVFNSGENFIDYYKNNKDIDLLILDICMNKISGMEVAKLIRKEGYYFSIIFLTSFKNYVLQGYDVKAANYLLKSYSSSKISKQLEKVIKEIDENQDNYIIVKNDEGLFKITKSEIMYIETYKRNTLIHTKNEDILSYKKMKQHEEILGKQFMRIHESYIVNIEYICKVTENSVFLKVNKELNLSKGRRKDVMAKLSVYLCNKF